MSNDIVKTLTLMCDKENPQDKKLLLLAELVETKCEGLAARQASLQECLDKTNEKLDKLTDLLENYENATRNCPVYQNKENFEKVSFFIKYPRLSVLLIVGAVALLAGFFSSGCLSTLRFIFGA